MSFVVGRATGVDLAVLLYRLKRRRIPTILQHGRHHVIVPIHQYGRLVRPGTHPLSIHNRMAGRGHRFGLLQAQCVQMRCQPFCRPLYIVGMGRVSTEAGEAKKLKQFMSKSLCMVTGILARFLARLSHTRLASSLFCVCISNADVGLAMLPGSGLCPTLCSRRVQLRIRSGVVPAGRSRPWHRPILHWCRQYQSAPIYIDRRNA